MAKQIKSYKDLSIRWDDNRQRFMLEARAIGGGQLPFAAKSEAVAKAKEVFERWRDGAPVAVEVEWTLDNAIEKYLEMSAARVKDDEDRYGPATLHSQTQQLHFIAHMKLNDLRMGKMKVRNFDADLMINHLWPTLKNVLLSNVTAMNYYVTFKQMLNICVDKKQIASNVARDATLKTRKPRVILPSKKEISQANLKKDASKVTPETLKLIISAIPNLKDQLIVYTASNTGLRAGELCMVRKYQKTKPQLGGIDFENNVIIIEEAKKRGPKSSEDFVGGPKSEQGKRRVPISPELSRRLEEYWVAMPVRMKAEGWLFPTRDGTRADSNNWRNRILYPACERAGLGKDERPTWHMLRHAYATAFLTKRGRDWIKAMELMGHADVSTTMMYKHIIDDPEQNEAIANDVEGFIGIDLDNLKSPPEPASNIVKLVATG
uniref:Integrase n=1 Tax=uncultured nuHF2 cluster bacterium HF0770_42C12 TaxID=723593 RepID=E7C7Z9_9BACT|nr:integrase [uncultured nuHF2 cluster bacterium HF0770_42C12]